MNILLGKVQGPQTNNPDHHKQSRGAARSNKSPAGASTPNQEEVRYAKVTTRKFHRQTDHLCPRKTRLKSDQINLNSSSIIVRR